MGKEINEGDTRHPATPGQSHSLQIYPNKMEKTLTFGGGRLFHLCSKPSWLGLHPLETPVHALHSPLCTPVKEPVLHPPDASVHGAWGALHPWGTSGSGNRLGCLWHPLLTLRVTHRDGGGAEGQPTGWLLSGTCLAPALLFVSA